MSGPGEVRFDINRFVKKLGMEIDLAWLQGKFPEIRQLKELESGGQKSVFSGETNAEGAIVLKVFHPNADIRRVEREVEAVKILELPAVPKVFEVGFSSSPLGDVVWLREELINGVTLRHRLRKSELSNSEVLRLAKQQLEILLAAEEHHLVHRDVKPENIMVTEDGGSWLLDFGIVRHLDLESLTRTAAHFGVGTPGYAAPEQFRNIKDEIDGRADLFALGITLYECCEGINPLVDGARDVLEVIRRAETLPLGPISRDIGPDGQFRELVMAMTRIRRNHRPSSVREAYEWLSEFV